MKIILLTLTYLVGIGELILGIYFWAKNSKSEVRRVMSIFALSMGIWVIMNGLTAFREPAPIVSNFISILFLASIVMVIAFFHFSLLYPYPVIRLDKFHRLLMYIPIIFFAVLLFSSNTIIRGYTLSPNISGFVLPGSLYAIYSVFFAVVFIAAIIILFRSLKRIDGFQRRHLIQVLWSLLIPGIPGILFSIFREANGQNYNTLISPILSGVWLAVIANIVRKP